MSLFYGQDSAPPTITIPRCIITMFHNSSTKPTGWAECNGKNGTHDLRDKFIVAAGTDSPTGTTGEGSTLTLTIDNLPLHYHPTVLFSTNQVHNQV